MSDVATPNSSENLEIVNTKIFIDDTEIDNTYQLTEIAIFKKINKLNKADVYFIDGDVAEGKFPIMESNDFKPGTPVKIEIGYGTGEENEITFAGIIVQVDIQTHSERKPLFVLRCVDEAFKMSLNQQYFLYEQKKDADLFNDIIDRYEVTAATIESTTYEHPSIIQFGISDWDFLLSRAKSIGCVVYTNNGKISIKKPDADNKTLQVNFGKDIIRQKLSFTARSILPDVTASSWNATDQILRNENANEISIPQQGDEETDTSSMTSTFSDIPQKLLSHADLDTSVISDWASGELLSAELSKINGYLVVSGTNDPELDSSVEILRMGNYFTGNGYITGIDHTVKDGKWITKITIGLKKEVGYNNTQISPNQSNLRGLQVGLVKQIHDDPAGNTRILVEIPGLEGESEGVWARVLQRYATNGAGSMFFPEIGNEVILGFLSNDLQAPIVLGSLFSQTNAPPFELEENNQIKAFFSREQLTFSFDEEKKAISLSTPENNKIILSDELKGIRFEDQNGNVLALNDKGILIESQSDLKIKTTGDVTIESSGNTKIKASSGDVITESMNYKVKANMKIEEQANIIESKATAQTVIKGGIVKIN